jgi:DNA recombination protein RmuC
MNKLVEGKGNLIISVEKLKRWGKSKEITSWKILARAEQDENQLLN